MKICVYGVGAVGGHLAGRLAETDSEISVVARGRTLQAIQQHGLTVQTREGTLVSHPVASDQPETLGPQDIVIVAVKAPSLPDIAERLSPLLHEDSRVLFVTNGIPWWYFHGHHHGELNGTQLPRLDPERKLEDFVGIDRTVGAVAYTAGTVVGAGTIRAENPRNRLIIGRPDGQTDSTLDEFATALSTTGVEATVTAEIRDTVWAKLIMNIVGGSLAVLTASPMKHALDKPAIAEHATKMAQEASTIARALGCTVTDPAKGLTKLASSGHLQSVAQDLLTGRSMEIDALFRVPIELAHMLNVETPHLDLIVELVTQRARAAGLYDATV